jgi:hypothetical protein
VRYWAPLFAISIQSGHDVWRRADPIRSLPIASARPLPVCSLCPATTCFGEVLEHEVQQ